MFMSVAASPLTTSARFTTSAWALAGRFACFISGLREAMATSAGNNPAVMDLAARLWNRLTEAAERFAAIAAHPAVRSPRRPAEPAPVSADAMPANTMPARPAAPRRTLPRSHGWLARMAPETVPCGIEFAHLLAQPEMTELLAAAPRLWRVLRPLCRMFGITPHDAPPPAPDTPPRRAPDAGHDPDRLRRRSEAAAIRDHGPLGYRPPLFGY